VSAPELIVEFGNWQPYRLSVTGMATQVERDFAQNVLEKRGPAMLGNTGTVFDTTALKAGARIEEVKSSVPDMLQSVWQFGHRSSIPDRLFQKEDQGKTETVKIAYLGWQLSKKS